MYNVVVCITGLAFYFNIYQITGFTVLQFSFAFCCGFFHIDSVSRPFRITCDIPKLFVVLLFRLYCYVPKLVFMCYYSHYNMCIMGFMITVKLSTKGNVYEQDEDV